MSTAYTKLINLADAIRAKSGVSGKLTLDGMKDAVLSIQQGIGEGSIKFGYWNADGKFQELNLAGSSPTVTGDPIEVDAVTFRTGKPTPSYGCVGDGEGNEATGASNVKFGYWTKDAGFVELDLSGESIVETGETISGDVISFDTGKEVPDYGCTDDSADSGASGGASGGINVYRCTEVDTGDAYGPYQDTRISGVTSPSGLSGDYSITDPTDLGNNRIFRLGNYQLGYDHNNKAWCINEGTNKPDYISSVFYSKIEGFSAEDGSSANPIWWDSDGVATSDRTITSEYHTMEAPYNEDAWMYEGWHFYVRLKAGIEYTIGFNCPEDDWDNGYEYWPMMYLKNTSGSVVAEGTRDTALTIGGSTITCYCKYTPSKDDLFIINIGEEYTGVTTPVACSPAPEISKNPSEDLFDQTNWKVGGGKNAGFEVVSAGLSSCVQKFSLISGTGSSEDSVWRSEDGNIFCYLVYNYDNYVSWAMYTESGNQGTYYYRSDIFTNDNIQHPGAVIWNARGLSDYGSYPVINILALAGVSGVPTLSPIDRQGREALGYATWTGEKMVQDDNGVWQGTGEIKSGMQTSRFVPAPGNIYNSSCDAEIETYKGIKGALYSWGSKAYGQSKQNYIPTLLTDVRFEKISAGNLFIFGIDKDGYMWGCGDNSQGQLGLGDSATRETMTKIGDKRWKQVSCGTYHTAAIDADGYLWTTGSGSYGQLCDGGSSNSFKFKKIGSKTWKSVFCRTYRTYLIDQDNYLWGAGSGNYIWGDGTNTNKATLTKLNDKTWTSIYGNSSRIFAIDTDGYMWVCGSNIDGCLGTGDSSDVNTFTKIDNQKWKMVATGNSHTIAINSEGYMYVCGLNNIGQLGTGDDEQPDKPFKNGNKKWRWVGAAGNGSIAIDIYGKAYWFGDASYMTPYTANTPQQFNIPGNCTTGSVYDYTNMYLLTNE